ncbi:glycosyltransferase family protein [Parapedobacter koreensis]|uniref:Glycosyl transferases group 1 n=1 Tax=Parapedobacter koreensis TaxID=332977 RepID=A0A1H7GGE8_9SPHI|nr:glycosyltransferase [Parapedobacter koreensis]SEK35992.1 Glycosyl transferases group 1 [Parapedobacter koreensis]
MLKIAYIFELDNPYTFAAKTIAYGFRNAFTDKGDDCRFFDLKKLGGAWGFSERWRLLRYHPDLIFISLENIHLLPKKMNNDTKLVIWGQFYKPCDYEAQIHHMQPTTKKLLQQLSARHDILIWSQHDDAINEEFFAGYTHDMGLKFVQLLHAADKTAYLPPSEEPPVYDFMWVGNISHRKDQYEAFITPLKTLSANYLDYSEFNKGKPHEIEQNKLYSKSAVIPSIHTSAQVKHGILVNERVFTASMQGGFQICDNPLARKYFSAEELVIAETPQDFLEAFKHFSANPASRLPYIRKMQANVLQNHTYHHRINTLLDALRN